MDSDANPPTPLAPAVTEPPPRARGDTVGRYVVVDTIGHGGMGVVHAAWDPQLDRRIALKLVALGPRTGLGTDGEIHRLRLLREAQALARLEHPHVVKVHDVGVCRVAGGDGLGEDQVFIAMEHVAGRSLRAWLRTDKPGLRAVLEVFVAAGRGLAAAHRAGLVHRDFKPDNVLVGDGGEVKVVDFGLARDNRSDDRPRARDWAETEPAVAAALGRASEDVPEPRDPEPSAGHSQDPGSQREDPGSQREDPGSQREDPGSQRIISSTGNITVTGTVLGTPAYMAPEQHAMSAVDARSDQYAFCVSLWEALYGKRPFSGRRSDVLAQRKRKLQIRESSRGLRVPRSLRTLLLRGLSVDPRRRFADIDELLGELEAHLAVRRRRLIPVVALAAAAAAALGIIASSSLFAADDEQAPCAAPVERLDGVWDDARRRAVERAVLASDLAYADDTWARVEAGLDAYRERWLAAEVEVCEAANLRGEHDAAWLEQRLACLDDRRRALASLTAQLARSDARTVEHAARAVGSLPPIAACSHARAATDLTPLPGDADQRARVDRALDQLADARAKLGSGHLDEGLAVAREVLAGDPARGWPALEAEALFVLANVQADLDGELAGQRRSLHAAAGAALRGDHPRLAILAWSRLARGLVEAREFAEAERWLAQADGLATVLARAVGEDQRVVADLEHTRAQLRFHQGDFAGAEAHARRRLALLREFYGPQNPRVADGLNHLGVTVYMQYRKDEAVAAYREALAILERVQGPDHPSVAMMHNNIGVVSTDRKLYTEALDHYRRAVEIRRRVYPRTHELVLQSQINLANLHLFSGDAGPGVGVALEVVLATGERLADQGPAEPRSGTDVAAVEVQLVPELLRLARLFAGAGEHRNALVTFTRALELLDAVPGARLPPDFVVPAKGEPWPPHLEGCRADVLLGIEEAARALGRDDDADRARAERTPLPVKQPAWFRRCIDEMNHWTDVRGE